MPGRAGGCKKPWEYRTPAALVCLPHALFSTRTHESPHPPCALAASPPPAAARLPLAQPLLADAASPHAGRTGRAGTKGRATSLWNDRDSYLVTQIKQVCRGCELSSSLCMTDCGVAISRRATKGYSQTPDVRRV